MHAAFQTNQTLGGNGFTGEITSMLGVEVELYQFIASRLEENQGMIDSVFSTEDIPSNYLGILLSLKI